MSTEQRDVRPFTGPAALEALLRQSILRFGVQSIESGDKKVVEEHEFINSPARLELARSPEELQNAVRASRSAFETLGIEETEVGFAIILQSSFLKILDVWMNVSLAELLTREPHFDLTSAGRPDALRSPRSGCTIEAIFYYRGNRTPRPKQPWRYGTWIARGTFEVSTELAFAGFTPQPLTASEKAAKKLAPKATRYITLNGNSPLESRLGEAAVEVWCDADLLATMSASPKAPSSVALQRQLFVDAIATIISAARDEAPALASAGWADVEESLLGRVVEAIAPSGGSKAARSAACSGYLEMIKVDPARFMTYVEETAGLLGSYETALGG